MASGFDLLPENRRENNIYARFVRIYLQRFPFFNQLPFPKNHEKLQVKKKYRNLYVFLSFGRYTYIWKDHFDFSYATM